MLWREENFAGCQSVTRVRVCRMERKIRNNYKITWQKDNLAGSQGVGRDKVFQWASRIRESYKMLWREANLAGSQGARHLFQKSKNPSDEGFLPKVCVYSIKEGKFRKYKKLQILYTNVVYHGNVMVLCRNWTNCTIV